VEKASIEEIRLLLKYIAKGMEIPKVLYDEVMNAGVREIEEKQRVVLIKRDPNISRGRFQARYVKLIAGDAVELHPATVTPFGADFDGDTLAVYAPLSEQSQKEARTKMVSAVLSSTINAPNFELSNEMFTGIFTLTSLEDTKSRMKSVKDFNAIQQLPIEQKVSYKLKGAQKTTAGRIIFNSVLPKWYGFVDEPVDKKKLKSIMTDIINKNHEDFVTTTDKLMDLAFYYATIRPMSYGIDFMTLSPKLVKLKKQLAEEKDVARQSEIITEMEKELLIHLEKKHPNLYMQIAAGAAKGVGQLRQLMVCKGLIADPEGNIMPPVVKSIHEGFTPREYVDAAVGNRKGTIDRALNTAHGGYSFRKIVFVMGDVELNQKTANCLTREGLHVKLTPQLLKKLPGRYRIGEEGRIVPVSNKLLGQKIILRSPVFCKTKAICHICYGDLHKQIKTKNIGIAAAQEMNISERIMKSFHLGGAVSLMPVDIIDVAMEDLDEIKRPKLEKLVKQVEDDLITKSDFTMIRLDKDLYKLTPFDRSEKEFKLPVGYFELNFRDMKIQVAFEQETILYITDDIEEDKQFVTLIYGQDDKLFTVKPIPKDYTKLAKDLDGLVGGKGPWFDPSSLYMKFMKTLYVFDEIYDSVHVEVLISNILRNKRDPQKPARLVVPYDPKLYSIKKLPMLISWPLGLAFEDFSKAVRYGMISDRSPSSPIEKIMFGEGLTPESTKGIR